MHCGLRLVTIVAMANAVSDPTSAAVDAPRSTTLYFVLAYAITWLALLPPSLAALGLLDASPEDLLAGAPIAIFGPAIAAMIASYREGGRPRVRELLAGMRAWNVAPLWFAVALVMPMLLYVPVRAIYGLVPGNEGGPYFWPPGDAQHVIAALLVPIGEEIGWRGFAQPRLLASHGPLRASIIIGLLWGGWHLPMFIAVGAATPYYLALMLPYFVAGGVMFTWLYRRTNGSLLLAVLLHVGVHLHNPNQAEPGDVVPITLSAISYVLFAIAVLAFDRKAFPRDQSSTRASSV